MHVAFEKIINELVDRRTEVGKDIDNAGDRVFPIILAYDNALLYAIEVVGEVAEEYKDKDCSKCSRRSWYQIGYADAEKRTKWIPCSERLPDTAGWYLGHVENASGSVVSVEKVLWKKSHYGKWKWYRKGNNCEVIEWQPLPEIYRKKVEVKD